MPPYVVNTSQTPMQYGTKPTQVLSPSFVNRARCSYVALSFYLHHISSITGNQRPARVAGVDIYVVNLTTTDSGRIIMSFYVTLFREALSAESLETLLRGASALNATLSRAGVTIVRVYQPNEITAAPEQTSGSTNTQVVILGVLLGVAGGVILIGALTCLIIAGYVIWSKSHNHYNYELWDTVYCTPGYYTARE